MDAWIGFRCPLCKTGIIIAWTSDECYCPNCTGTFRIGY